MKVVNNRIPDLLPQRRAFLAGAASAALLFLAAPAAFAAKDLLNKPAPAFTRKDFDGQPLSLSRFRGKVVLLNFWATWCAPCLAEMPTFSAWQQQYGSQGLAVVGISMDDEPAPARRLAQRLKLSYPVAMGDDRLGNLYGGVYGLPLTFLIDRKGVIRFKFQGEVEARIIEKQLHALLQQPAH